jgi:hypothetical protein
VAAARRAEALRAVLVRLRLALVARRWPVERVLVLVLAERLLPFERAPVERLVPVERVVPVERRVVLLELRRALLRVVLLALVAMWVRIPPPGVRLLR